MRPHSILFCGTPEFACPSLEMIAHDPAFEIAHVITQPDRPVGRKQKIMQQPVKRLAKALNIPVLQPKDINMLTVPEDRPDYLVVVAYGQVLRPHILAIPTIAPVNLHASLLPRWRGASPVQHAILAGDNETGVTVQRMAEKLDAGPILAQERLRIDARETTKSLTEHLSVLGAKLLVEALKQPLNEMQQDESLATICRKLTRAEGDVQPKTMTAEEIDRRVRALVPWPGVKMPDGTKIIETSIDEDEDAFALPCARGTTLYVLKLQKPGGTVVNGREWANT
jgi:methionyl-tRNA formyltransferase